MKVIDYQAINREAVYKAWHEAKRRYIEQQVLVIKDEQLQPLANMCHYNGEALMRALEGFQRQVLREGCDIALARKRPAWRPDIRLLALIGILLLGLAVAYTARILSKRFDLRRKGIRLIRNIA